jgi:hypothetical protein
VPAVDISKERAGSPCALFDGMPKSKRSSGIEVVSTDSDSEFIFVPARMAAGGNGAGGRAGAGAGAGAGGGAGGVSSHRWLRPNQTMDAVILGLTEFCHQSGLECKARVRSSDKMRATINCRHHETKGCSLRLTVRKNMIQRDLVSPNPDSFVSGSCVDISTIIGSALVAQSKLPPLSASVTPGIPAAAPPVVATNAHALPPLSASVTPGIPAAAPPVVATNARALPPLSAVLSLSAVSATCTECQDPAVIGCAKGDHHWCAQCLKQLADEQIADFDLFRKRHFKFICPYDGTSSIRSVMETLEAHSQSEAKSAFDVGKVNAIKKSDDIVAEVLAHVRHLVIPRCPKCDIMIADFDACAALVCGRRLHYGEHVEHSGGCGANICAWCMKEIAQHENHHEHVRSCTMNPIGSLFPPTPHPQVWLQCMAILARERVFNIVEQIRSADIRVAIYSEVRSKHPELDLSQEWLDCRHMWLTIMLETGTDNIDVHRADRCRILLQEMGFLDNEVLRRAILFCDCVINDVINAMRALCEQENDT